MVHASTARTHADGGCGAPAGVGWLASSSTRRASGVLRFLLVALAFASISVLAPYRADAATWPLGGSRGEPSLGFHETYTAGAESYLHSGVDAPASAGSQILSPAAGTVTFTGSVPSGDALVNGGGEGQVMRAVSVRIPDGRTLTLMPFAQVGVKRGQHVEEGAVLGALAASGDRSSSATHLHMGLKMDGTYYDPMTLFGAAAADEAVPQTSADAAAAAALPATALAEPEAAAGNVEPVSSQEGLEPDASLQAQSLADALMAAEDAEAANPAESADASTAQEARRTAGGAEGKTVSQGFGSISSGAVTWQPAPRRLPWPLAAAHALLGDVAAASGDQALALAAGVQALAVGTGLPVGAIAVALCAAGVAAVAAIGYAAARWAAPFVKGMWKNVKCALVSSKAG